MIHEEIKSRLNLDNACYHSVQNLLFFHLLSQKVKIKIYRTIILSVVLYGYETSYHTLRKGHKLRVLKVLRRIFGPNRDEITEIWRKLHNEKLHNLYLPPNITVNKNEMSRACSMDGREQKNAYRVLVGKSEDRSQGRSSCRLEDNIKLDLRETGWGSMDSSS
jgi:hypothetical protein